MQNDASNGLLGSQEEVTDLKAAYLETKGSIDEIMTFIPHSTTDDEGRFIVLITNLISQGDLAVLPSWESSTKDEKARLVRKKQGNKEAKEAEQLAKDLGVWDEFYGSGKAGKRKAKGKGKATDDEDDTSALQALILKKRQNSAGFFDNLAAKYGGGSEEPKKSKGKKRARATDDEDEGDILPKRSRKGTMPPPPEIDDEAFEKLQQEMFGQKAKGKESESKAKPASKTSRTKGKAKK